MSSRDLSIKKNVSFIFAKRRHTMTQHILTGSVKPDGCIDHYSSTDENWKFEVKRLSEGTYRIRYNPAFQPVSVVGTVFIAPPAQGQPDLTPISNFTVEGFTKTEFTALTGDVHGKRSDHFFSFIIIGE